jgi:hypothetical protein
MADAGAGPTQRLVPGRPAGQPPGRRSWQAEATYGQASQRPGRRECQREVPLRASFQELSASLVSRP